MTPPPDDRSQQAAAGDDDSLRQLSDAFAEMLRSDGEQPGDKVDALAAEKAAGETGAPSKRPLVALRVPQAPEDCPITPKSILEAMLFVGHPDNEQLTAHQAAAVINGISPREINDLVDELRDEYDREGYAYEIVSDGAGYRLALRDQYDRVRNRFYGRIRETRLSQAAVEVLSLVAYNQPTTSAKVSNLRGHPSGAILAQLVRRQLLRMERPEQKPRTPVYYTTPRFLKLFGLTSLVELPESQDA